MRLLVRDVARLFSVSERVVLRWVEEDALPVHRVNDQYRFNPAELVEWATARKIPVSPEIFHEPEDGTAPPPGIVEALRAGGVFHGVGGTDKASVLREVVARMPLPPEADREFLLQVFLAREALGSTGIGDGVAIPHARQPIVLHVAHPTVTLCFLERPIAFAAIDGKPVHALFSIVSPTVRAHLHVLSRLSYLLRNGAFAAAVARRASRDEVLALAARVEAGLA